MNFAVALYRRFALLIHEVAKFGIIGAVAFVITWAGTNLLHFGLGAGPLTSNAVATVVAATFAYAGNKFWTFRHRADSGLGREYFLFFVLNGVGLLIQLLCIGFTHYTLHLEGRVPYNVALIIGIVFGTLFRYWSYKKWVFLPPQVPAVDARTGLPSREPVVAPDSLKGTYTGWKRAGADRPGDASGPGDVKINGHPINGSARSPYAGNRDGRTRGSWEVRTRPGADGNGTRPLGGGDPPRSDD